MPDGPEFEQGTGATQLPKGAATQLNQAQEQSEDMREEGTGTEGQTTEDLLAGVQFVDPAMANDEELRASRPQGDDEEFMLGETERPQEPVVNAAQFGRSLPMPVEMENLIPALEDLRLDGDDSGTISALLSLINYHTGE